MKKLFTSICLFLIFNTSAQVDYTYCSQFIKDTNADVQKTGFSFPFTIDPKTGKLETTNFNISYDGENPGEHLFIQWV